MWAEFTCADIFTAPLMRLGIPTLTSLNVSNILTPILLKVGLTPLLVARLFDLRSLIIDFTVDPFVLGVSVKTIQTPNGLFIAKTQTVWTENASTSTLDDRPPGSSHRQSQQPSWSAPSSCATRQQRVVTRASCSGLLPIFVYAGREEEYQEYQSPPKSSPRTPSIEPA